MATRPMSNTSTEQGPRQLGFLLLPEFSMIAFFAAIEPLRIANRWAGRQLYEWSIYSRDGNPVAASNGMTLLVDGAINDEAHAPTVFVCSAFNHERYTSPHVAQWLTRLAGRGVTLGGIDTGAFVLANAGLLAGYRVTLHWESVPAFRELHPEIETTTELYEIDQRRLTSSGGTATMDLMLRFIAEDHDPQLANAVSEQLIHQRVRSKSDHQRMTIPIRLGVHNPALVEAIQQMAAYLSEPLTIADLARHSGISQRQLERLFAEQLGMSPKSYYLEVRLAQAKELLQETDRTILEIALACGFGSCAAFSRSYRRRHGLPPSQDRHASLHG